MLYRNTLRTLMTGALALGVAGAASAATECVPSKWGPDDELGAANYVTPERTLEALKLVKQGKSKPLGIVMDSKTPAFPPRSFSMQIVSPGQQGGQQLTQFGYPAIYNDDIVQTWVGIGSQLDGLGHLGEAGLYYNCNTDKAISALTGLTKLGTHNVPPMIARAVIVDMAKAAGKDFLDAGEYFGEAEIKAAMDAQNVTVNEGDIVLFHTGWTDAKFESEPAAWGAAEPGITTDGARYVAAMNPMAVGADTWGVAAVPPKPGDGVFYDHVIFLQEHGIYILEVMNTGPLVEEGVQEFMFVLGHHRWKGAVQAMINPVALY